LSQGIDAATRMLRQRMADLPGINSINVFGTHGELLASSLVIHSPAPNYSDRDYFIEARDDSGLILA